MHPDQPEVPLHGAAAGLYFRLWLQAFPDHPITPTQAAEQVHYERLHSTQIDEYEATLRRKATDPHRLLAGIDCPGRHPAGTSPAGTRRTRRPARTTGMSPQPDPALNPDQTQP